MSTLEFNENATTGDFSRQIPATFNGQPIGLEDHEVRWLLRFAAKHTPVDGGDAA